MDFHSQRPDHPLGEDRKQTVSRPSAVLNELKIFEHTHSSRQGSKCFCLCWGVAELRCFARNARVVTTNVLDFIWSIRSIAVCICDVAIGARMANVMPIGRWWRVTEPIEVPGSASLRGWE